MLQAGGLPLKPVLAFTMPVRGTISIGIPIWRVYSVYLSHLPLLLLFFLTSKCLGWVNKGHGTLLCSPPRWIICTFSEWDQSNWRQMEACANFWPCKNNAAMLSKKKSRQHLDCEVSDEFEVALLFKTWFLNVPISEIWQPVHACLGMRELESQAFSCFTNLT